MIDRRRRQLTRASNSDTRCIHRVSAQNLLRKSKEYFFISSIFSLE
jgi:hypothetical protein